MKLSICIPAFERRDELNELIESILVSAKYALGSWTSIEVIISDNASAPPLESPRSTESVTFKLVRQEEPIEPARNFISAIAAASGEYCWLMGSDDIVQSNALRSIELAISEHTKSDVWVFDRFEGYSGGRVVERKWFRETIRDHEWDLSCDTEMSKWLSECLCLGGAFAFLSSLVFRRSEISIDLIPEEIYSTAYSHSYVLFRARPCIACGLPPIVSARMGNDSFSGQSAFGRNLIDVDGYSLIVKLCQLPVEVIAQMECLLVREFVRYSPSLRITLYLVIYSSKHDRGRLRIWLSKRKGVSCVVIMMLFLPEFIILSFRFLARARKYPCVRGVLNK